MAADNVGAVKIDGYLEKKGKMKVVTTWKRYWFVLEGRLLLYYRSQEEYEKLSPCKGSINMGLATSIRPGLGTAGVFQIITRTNTITLRAKERAVQEKWLQALLDASGQQSVTNPIKMSHFRYSMDDLIPASAKQQQHQPPQSARNTSKRSQLNRQNTLPHRFTATTGTNLDRSNTIIERIRHLGGQSYIGSVDALNRIAKRSTTDTSSSSQQQQQRPMAEDTRTHHDEAAAVTVSNDLYSSVLVENAEYVSAAAEVDVVSEGPAAEDHNKNSYLIENAEYIRSEEQPAALDGVSEATLEDIEYYCTYEEINNLKAQLQSHIYNEPVLPPRPPDECTSCGGGGGSREEKKQSSFMKFARRLTSFKTPTTDDGRKKRSTNLIMKVMMGRRKNSSTSGGSEQGVVVEPIYDTVDYYEIDRAQQQKQDAMQLLRTLAELQQTLEAKKSKIQDIIVATASSPTSNEPDTQQQQQQSPGTDEAQARADATGDSVKDTTAAAIVAQDTEQPTDGSHPPGLPPRHTSRPRSPFHDVPRNNTPVHSPTTDEYSLDKILDDLEQQSRRSAAADDELSVRALIDKFNQSAGGEPAHTCAAAADDDTTNDVALRHKADVATETAALQTTTATATNRHSDELAKLLEELTKVTSAPLLTPGVTSSLVQMKSVPVTDEEWLAIAPIRRRRHSEPDYDVPRPHRSLQILPRSPDSDGTEADTVIPATRFFGPVLPTYDKSSYPDVFTAWRSMTPDSLEPLHLVHVQRTLVGTTPSGVCEHDRSVGAEFTLKVVGQPDAVRDVLCATVGSELSDSEANGGRVAESVFLDSLEPFTESATAF